MSHLIERELNATSHIVDDAVGARIKSGGDLARQWKKTPMPTTVTLISAPNQ